MPHLRPVGLRELLALCNAQALQAWCCLSQTTTEGLELLFFLFFGSFIFGWQLLCLTLLDVRPNCINWNIFSGISWGQGGEIVLRGCLQKPVPVQGA